MARPSVTITAAMRAPAVRIYAVSKSNIRAIVLGNDRLRFVWKILRRRPTEFSQILFVLGDVLQVTFDVNRQIPVRRLNRRPAPFQWTCHAISIQIYTKASKRDSTAHGA